ncbi:MAG TPA: hypothetical protein IAA04_10915 [Candidatus Lachnoclostridium pullistercoris]|uniref:Uncharacterized protein n=1 Tax=Candidatus Lachnoclostridium pullistercoris TaxID=2838632 RepID=A0A9D2T6Q5_9FIRM|nr:hypothetical protein [Candidatus Lachnoclostridium pullistercoris]
MKKYTIKFDVCLSAEQLNKLNEQYEFDKSFCEACGISPYKNFEDYLGSRAFTAFMNYVEVNDNEKNNPN